jgi:hypothetical protein
MHEDGSNDLGPARSNVSSMETSPHHLSNQRRSCAGTARVARLFWKYTSRAVFSTPKIPAETVALIKEMAEQNRGELLKLGLHVCLPHHSEIHETYSLTETRRTDMGYLPGEPYQRQVSV